MTEEKREKLQQATINGDISTVRAILEQDIELISIGLNENRSQVLIFANKSLTMTKVIIL